MSKTVELGKIRCPHGVKGEVFLISFSKSFDWLEDLSSLPLKKKQKNEEGKWEEKHFDFPILRKKPHKVGYILKLEGLDDRSQAEDFKGAILELPEEFFGEVKEDSFYLMKLKGFQVEDETGLVLGKISRFSTNGVQDLLVMKSEDGKEIDIPYVDSIVKEILFEKQKMIVSLPEGLLEL